MSDQVMSEGSNTQSEGAKENEVVLDAKALAEQLKALQSTNARLLEESKKAKEQYKTASSLVEQAEREKLEKEGNYQGLLESERKRAEKLETENKTVKQKVLKSNIQATIARLAGEVHSLDDVLNQPSFSHILNKGINSDELTLSEDVAKEYLNELFTAKPYLKKSTQNTNVVNNKPSYQTGNGGVKPVSEMDASEIEKLLKEKFK
jgi:hypothetical protein